MPGEELLRLDDPHERFSHPPTPLSVAALDLPQPK
jgi:hypothetical protein